MIYKRFHNLFKERFCAPAASAISDYNVQWKKKSGNILLHVERPYRFYALELGGNWVTGYYSEKLGNDVLFANSY